MTTSREHEVASGEDPTRSNNRNVQATSKAPADAVLKGTYPPPDRVPQRAAVRAARNSVDHSDSAATHQPISFLDHVAPLPGLRLRETSVVYLTVMLRLVGYDQLRRLVLPHHNAAAVRKVARSLEEEGWLRRWNAPISGVGRLGHVHPTAKALNAVLDAIPTVLANEPWSKVVHLMLPRSGRRALDLSSRPKWFAHQREVNQLATSLMCSRRPLWISTWDSPFPAPRSGESSLPQPDYVLIERDDHGPILVFGEHDRGHEPIERFTERKLRAYARLSAMSLELTGFRSFRVDVTVIDVVGRNPKARLSLLANATREYGLNGMFRFTLGGWLYANPASTRWLSDSLASDDAAHSAAFGPFDAALS